ncbi:MAG: LysM peptidoglycan-binding domain-containing protein [bacterium]|nr:LysM peptidoglycan-binding domain-containing protein [bacterium]
MKKFLVVLLALTILTPLWGVAAPDQVLEDSLTVIIKKEDTICKIAKQYMKNPRDWREMLKSEGNRHIKNSNRIYPGQLLTIPNHMLKEQYVKKYVKNEEVEKLKTEIEDLKVTIEEKNKHISKLEKELFDKYAYIEEQELKITRFQADVSTLTMSLNNKDTLLAEKEKELQVAKAEVEKMVEKTVMLEKEYQTAQKAVNADKMLARAIISIEQANQKGASRYEKKLIKNAELLKEKAAWAQLRREYDKSIILAEESIRDASEAEHIAVDMAGKYKLSFLFDHFYFWDLKNKPTLLKLK